MAKLPSYPLVSSVQVLRTRIDGSVVVIECSFSINLTALTLEQVSTLELFAWHVHISLHP